MIIARIDTATGRINVGFVSAGGPFSSAPQPGERDVPLTVDRPPAAANGKRQWGWCRVTETGDVVVDPTLVPPAAPDRRAALVTALATALAEPVPTPRAMTDVLTAFKAWLG